MASSAFSSLRTEFYARGFDYLEYPSGTHTRANRFINQGYMDILSAEDWPFLIQSLTDFAPLSITGGAVDELRTVEQVIDLTTNTRLEPIDRRDIPGGQLTLAGNPQYYWLERNYMNTSSTANVKVWPTNTTHSIKLWYYAYPNVLSADADLHVIPQRYEGAIIQYAIAYAYMDADNPQMAAVARAEGDRIVNQMRIHMLWDSVDFPDGVQRISYSSDSVSY